jgi:hypothetical protein
MTEREFEQRLRAFYRAEVEAAGQVPADLVESVASIPDRVPYRPGLFQTRRGVVLLAAALLMALLVSGAIAVGTGLIRLPWLPDERTTQLSGPFELLGPTPCNQTLPDDLLLSVELSKASGPPMQVLLYASGLVLKGARFGEEVTPPWQQRTMTAEGIAGLIAAIEASELRDCKDVPVAGDQLEIKARTRAGVVAMSLGSGWLRVASQPERDAAQDLAARLVDSDLGIPSEGWVDAAWLPYELERWQIFISRWEGNPDAFAGFPRMDWVDLVLPDGSTPMTYGESVPVAPDSIFTEERCQEVGAIAANEMRAFLDEVSPDPGTWGFRDRTGGVQFNVVWRLPHEAACQPSFAGPQPSPRGTVVGAVRPCDLLPVDVGWSQPREDLDHGADWGSCEYLFDGWVFVSRHPVSADQAVIAVAHQFGIGFTTDQIAGQTVYFNACADPAAQCSPAVAISAEPHFVIVVPDEGTESELRTLATALIEHLDQEP